MLIDWITAKIDERFLSESIIEKLRLLGDRILRINPQTGDIVYETNAWDPIRSDSHNITYLFASDY